MFWDISADQHLITALFIRLSPFTDRKQHEDGNQPDKHYKDAKMKLKILCYTVLICISQKLKQGAFCEWRQSNNDWLFNSETEYGHVNNKSPIVHKNISKVLTSFMTSWAELIYFCEPLFLNQRPRHRHQNLILESFRSFISTLKLLQACLKEQFTQKWRCAHPQAFQDCFFIRFVEMCLSNGCSAVNGCRQNESLIKTSQ